MTSLKHAIHWSIAYAAVAISALFAARYGIKMADTDIDGALRAASLFVVAVISAHGAAWAVKTWKKGHPGAGVLIGVGAFICFAVTLAGGLGTIAAGSDVTQGQRATSIDRRKTDKAELDRLRAQRAVMPAFRIMDRAGVDAAQRLADTATASRKAECGNGNPSERGRECRKREDAERQALAALSAAAADQAATARAADLDQHIADLADHLKTVAIVQSANPQATFLARLLPLSPEDAEAIYALFFALAVEAGAMLAMLSAEINTSERRAAPTAPRQPEARAEPVRPAAPSARKNSNVVSIRRTPGGLDEFADARLIKAAGSAASAKDICRDYWQWCAANNKERLPLGKFAAELQDMCKRRGITLEDRGSDHVCLDVKLSA